MNAWGHREPLAVAASTPARMSDRPLVYYAARCSGGTAIHAILRDLLVLHGVRLFAAPHLGYSAELIQSRHGPDALTRFHAQAANRSETLLFSVHAAETLENVSRTLHALGAAVAEPHARALEGVRAVRRAARDHHRL